MKNVAESKGLRAFPLVLYGFAALACLWAAVASISAMSQSVVAGITGLFLSFILAGMISWRISFKWKQLHTAE